MKFYAVVLCGLLGGCQTHPVEPNPPAIESAPSIESGSENVPIPVAGQPFNAATAAARGALDPLSPRSPLKKSSGGLTRGIELMQDADSDEAEPEPFDSSRLATREMALHAIDVGQGDAFLLEFACGVVLVDTGLEGGEDYSKSLTRYLTHFFSTRRPDLNNNLDLVVISHSHSDHANGVPIVFDDGIYTVANYIDNAYDEGKSGAHQELLREITDPNHYQPILAKDIKWRDGATSPIIDPIGDCGDGVDPLIRVLWGGMTNIKGELKNPNHHSVVLRVDYGQASFLLTGDIQTKQKTRDGGGLNLMFDDYDQDFRAFDVDGLKVAHHGAENGTIGRLLDAVSPCFSFMGVGDPQNDAVGTAGGHGHPRRATLDLLNNATSALRPQRTIDTFTKPRELGARKHITKAIFGTAWDGAYVIFAKDDGTYRVETERGEEVAIACR